MRVVYDTSVLAIIVSRRDLILQLQADISSGNVSLVTSLFIINELEKILATKFGLTKQGAKSRARLLARVSDIVQLKDIERVSRDPNDDAIVATAVTGRADYIVTLDDDLLVLKQHKSVQIVTPTEFRESFVQVKLKLSSRNTRPGFYAACDSSAAPPPLCVK